jgi:ABC-type dipeptide/oligopeptide/nickel transport system permease component
MASDAARFTAVVVLPTPPFWFAMVITFPISSEIEREKAVKRQKEKGIHFCMPSLQLVLYSYSTATR